MDGTGEPALDARAVPLGAPTYYFPINHTEKCTVIPLSYVCIEVIVFFPRILYTKYADLRCYMNDVPFLACL